MAVDFGEPQKKNPSEEPEPEPARNRSTAVAITGQSWVARNPFVAFPRFPLQRSL